jgi:hypothetical protein
MDCTLLTMQIVFLYMELLQEQSLWIQLQQHIPELGLLEVDPLMLRLYMYLCYMSLH